MDNTTTTEPPKKAGRPRKSKTEPIKDMVQDSKLAKDTKDTKDTRKDKKDKPPETDSKIKDSLKELSRVASANKKEINSINKKIENIIKKIK
jgi:hypothetical protein